MKNDKWKTAYHKSARSNIGAYKTDLNAKEYITKEKT